MQLDENGILFWYIFIFPFLMLQYTQKKNRMCISSTGTQDDLFYVNEGVRYCEL